MKLQGKVAVVTGAASGNGKAIAVLFAKEGAKVVVSDINMKGAEETVATIKADGGAAIAILTDVIKEEDIQKMIDAAVKTYGTVDILVNNAGIMDNYEPAADVTDAQWDRLFAINTTSVMRGTRKVLPIFLEKGAGVIVNIASIGGLHGNVAGVAYTASKHAVIGLTRSVGFQYANKGIRCNAIAPGAIQTNIASTITSPHPFGAQRCSISLSLNPRIGKPEEVAGAALFLASDDASFVNGQVLVVDGGWTN